MVSVLLYKHYIVSYICAHIYAEIAVSPNNNVVNIYEKKGKDWVKIHELNEHSGRITGTVTSVSSSDWWTGWMWLYVY